MSYSSGPSGGDSTVNTPPNGRGPFPPGGLPPVAPPTAGFLVRLFVVPALIVAVGVGAAILFQMSFGWLLGAPQTPQQFLAKFDDANEQVRWRAAADLTQRLPRDDRLASDPDFALELVKRLRTAHKDLEAAELELASRFPPMTAQELDKLADDAWLKRAQDLEVANRKLDDRRTYVKFLAASLSGFMVPVGVPVLRELALQEKGIEENQLREQRANALWSLAVLGENINRFDKLPPPDQQSILEKLAVDLDDPERAKAARDFLLKRADKIADAMDVDQVAMKCAESEDPFLRELSAFTLNFWFGDDAANQRMDKTLLTLSHDDGRGTMTVEQLLNRARRQKKLQGESVLTDNLLMSPDLNTKTVAYSVPPELNIKFNATIALARRGSDEVNTGRLVEMLDQDKLRTQFLRQDVTTEKSEPDEGMVIQTLVNTLKAVSELHKQRPQRITSGIRMAVNNLKTNANVAVKKEAEETSLAIGVGQ
jgi:hypothetical protein